MTDEQLTTGRLALSVVENGIIAYATHPVARAVVSVIPLGTFFDALAGTAGSNLVLDRLNVLVDELRQAIERVPAEKHDPAVTEQQLIDSAIRALRGSMETGNQEKVRTIAAALVGSTSLDRPRDLDVETVLEMLASLTPAELDYAAMLAKRTGGGAFGNNQVADPDGHFFVSRLMGHGLLETAPTSWTDWDNDITNYQLTPTFLRILDLLRAGGMVAG